MTKIEPENRSRHSAIFWAVVALLIVFVYFFGLSIPFLGPDEPRYAQVAREMYGRGDWVTPTLGGFNWFEKPALLYWLQIAAFNVFGVSEVTARLGPAIFGLGTVASLWVLGRSLATEDTENTKNKKKSQDKITKSSSALSVANSFPNWLALIAATSLGLIVFARGASFDIILTFPMTAAMVSFFIFDQRVRSNVSPYLPLTLLYFFVGVALLAKGLIGAVFPFAIIAFYFVLLRRIPGRIFLVSLFWGGLITIAVAATWYLPMYLRNGWEFIDQFIIQHHFQRYTSNKYFHPQPFYFFFWVLPLMTLPWLPFFFGGIWSAAKEFFYRRGTETQSGGKDAIGNDESRFLTRSLSNLLTFSAAWLLVPLAFFAFSGSKLPGYILPTLPPAIVFTAFAVLKFIGTNELRARVIKAVAVATLVIVTAMLIFVIPPFAKTDSVKFLVADADAKGYGGLKVLTLYTVSHNAEFYAPGRLERDATGKQRQLNNTGELAEMVGRQPSGSALVIYPLRLEQPFMAGTEITAQKISDNTEYAIAFVTRR